LKLLSSDKSKCFHDSTGKKTCLKTFIIPKLKIGEFTMHNVSGVMRDYMWGNKPEPDFIYIDAYKNGVIGLNVWREFNLLIDYPHEQAVLMKHGVYPKNYDVKNWVKIPFEITKYGITTAAKINSVDTLLSWNTAANHSVIMQSTMKKIARVPSEYLSFAPKKFTVGRMDVPSPELHIVDEGFPFDVIGSSYFTEHVVFIDFKNQYLFIQK
jgi:hypothetical protein